MTRIRHTVRTIGSFPIRVFGERRIFAYPSLPPCRRDGVLPPSIISEVLECVRYSIPYPEFSLGGILFGKI
jgi:hypothetical protein